ncbi:hypothetical protein PR001_g27523 [Phytophthora rubi]|uniref:Uncharacterized protein n=2 Tax=Phytophthora rubi TaxID=129364 RepID=A0A6A3HJ36_9STRA|nr:hypothetical protein PR001_g27523 [Phytophthora rubi]
MSASSVDTPAPSSPIDAATDPATGVYTAPVATSPAGSPTPSTVEAAANTSAPAPTACFSGSDGGPPAARRGARAARPQAELRLSSMAMATSAGPAARDPMTYAPSGAHSVSSIHVARPPLDRDAVRASISHLTGILDHVTALAALESDHEELQGQFWALQGRVGVLEEELASAYANAAPDSTTPKKMKDVQKSLDLEKQMRAATADFEAKLVSARAASNQLSVSDKDLQQVRSERDRALQRAAKSDEAARAWEASNSALDTASAQLRDQVEIQEAKVADLQDQLGRSTRSFQRQPDRAHEERDRVPDRAADAEKQLQQTTAELHQRTQDRDRIATNLCANHLGGSSSLVNCQTRTSRQ